MRDAYVRYEREDDKGRGNGGRGCEGMDRTHTLDYGGMERSLEVKNHLRKTLLDIDRRNYCFNKR